MEQTLNTAETLLDEKSLAQIIGVSLSCLQKWRFEKRGPKFIKLSRSLVRYRLQDVTAWLDSRPTGGDNPKGTNNE